MAQEEHVVVVGYDGSSGSRVALLHASRIAKCLGGRVMVTCAQHQEPSWAGLTPLGPMPGAEKDWEDMTRKIVEQLETAADILRAEGVDCSTACSAGSPAEVLVGLAREVDADMIVVGAVGSGRAKGLLGSTVSGVLRQTEHIPVLVVPE